MKKILMLLLMGLIGVTSVNAQLKIRYHYKIKNSYKFGGSMPLYYADTLSKMPDLVKLISESNRVLKANVIPDDSISGKLKVRFWHIIPATDKYQNSSNYVNSQDSIGNFYFQIPKQKILGDDNIYYSIPYALTEIGVLTIPFKYRFGHKDKNIPNDVSTDINGGLYVGRKWGRKRFYFDKSLNHESAAFTLAVFAGPTKIELTDKNVNNTTIFKKDSNELGVSAGFGTMYSYRSINIGLFGGFDFPVSTAGQNWFYSNKFWLGFGIGYSLNILSGGQ